MVGIGKIGITGIGVMLITGLFGFYSVYGKTRFLERTGIYEQYFLSHEQIRRSSPATEARLRITRMDRDGLGSREIILEEIFGQEALGIVALIRRCYCEELQDENLKPGGKSAGLSGGGRKSVRIYVSLEYDGKWGRCRIEKTPDLDQGYVRLFLDSNAASYRIVPVSSLPGVVRNTLNSKAGVLPQAVSQE